MVSEDRGADDSDDFDAALRAETFDDFDFDCRPMALAIILAAALASPPNEDMPLADTLRDLLSLDLLALPFPLLRLRLLDFLLVLLPLRFAAAFRLPFRFEELSSDDSDDSSALSS